MEEKNKVTVETQEPAPQSEEQNPTENPAPEQKQKLLATLKAKAEAAKEKRKQWREQHPKIAKGIKIVGTGLGIAAGVVGGLCLADAMAKRSESSGSVEEEDIPWEGEDLEETETTEESTEESTEE